jgi:hypothetical protein
MVMRLTRLIVAGYNKRNPKKGIESTTFNLLGKRRHATISAGYNKRNPKKGIERPAQPPSGPGAVALGYNKRNPKKGIESALCELDRALGYFAQI